MTGTRKARVQAPATLAGTPGEQAAAKAALARIETAAPQSAETARTRLTDAGVRKIPLPASGQSLIWDRDVSGFALRLTVGGSRSWVFNYRVRGSGQQRRVTIGQFGSWSASAAREEAKRLRRLVDGGEDPRGDQEKQREAPTVADLIARFEREYLPRKRPSTIKDYCGMLRRHIGPHFGKYAKVADIAYDDVDALHRKVTSTGSTYVANRCIALCSRMFSLAIKWKMRTDNPCKGIERNPEIKRRRYLSSDELQRLLKALAETPDPQFVNIITLLILTGARRGEVLSMRWSAIVNRTWTKPSSETKQKHDHTVPLSSAVLQLLASIERRGEYVFPSSDNPSGHIVEIKNGWEGLCKRAGVKGLRIHDLRHSFASQLASSGASLPLIGALLGHSSPTTTARYAHLFDDPQRAAVEKIGDIISNGNGNGDHHD
jgi:integrase